MKIKETYSLFSRLLALLLVVCLLVPFGLKLVHSYNHQFHLVCNDDGKVDTHFHEVDLNCEFYKFQLTKNLYIDLKVEELVENLILANDFSNFYISFKQNQQLTRFQRGPPELA